MTGIGRSLLAALMLALIPIVIGLVVFAFGETSQVRVFNLFLINLIIVVGLQVFMGNAKVVNLGHITWMGIGGYTAAILTMPLAVKSMAIPDAPFGLADLELGVATAAILALLLTCAVATLIGLVLTGESGITATILTIALLVIFHTIVVNWTELTRGARALFGIPVASNIWLLLAVSTVVIAVARLFRDSALGVQLRASGESRLAAECMGVNVRLLRLVAWVLSAGIIGIGGVMYVFLVGSISPKSFYFETTFLTLAMLILGGMGTVSGAVVGAVVVTVGFEIMRYFESGPELLGVDLPEFLGLTGFYLGLVIVVFMALRPQGLVGIDEIDEAVVRWWRARRSDRQEPAADQDR